MFELNLSSMSCNSGVRQQLITRPCATVKIVLSAEREGWREVVSLSQGYAVWKSDSQLAMRDPRGGGSDRT